MTLEQLQILGVLAVTIGLFVWGRWRHDVVALAALVASVLLGLVPSATAFSGFGHPAVITVACVLVLSWGLQSTGAVDVLAARVMPKSVGPLRSRHSPIGTFSVRNFHTCAYMHPHLQSLG